MINIVDLAGFRGTYSHDNTTHTYVRTQALTNPRSFPENPNHGSVTNVSQETQKTKENFSVGIPILVSIHPSWKELVEICAGADEEE